MHCALVPDAPMILLCAHLTGQQSVPDTPHTKKVRQEHCINQLDLTRALSLTGRPACSWAFSIWGLIFTLQGLGVIYTLIPWGYASGGWKERVINTIGGFHYMLTRSELPQLVSFCALEWHSASTSAMCVCRLQLGSLLVV